MEEVRQLLLNRVIREKGNLLAAKVAATVRKRPAPDEEEEILDDVTAVGDKVFPKLLPWQFANVGAGLGAATLGAGAYGVGRLADILPKGVAEIDRNATKADAEKRFGDWFDNSAAKTLSKYLVRIAGSKRTDQTIGQLRQDGMQAVTSAGEQSANSTASKALESVYNPIAYTYNTVMPKLKDLSPALRYGGGALAGAGGAYGLYHLYRMLNPPKTRRKSLYELGLEDTR